MNAHSHHRSAIRTLFLIGSLFVLWNPSFQAQTPSPQSGSAVTSMLAEFEHAKQIFPNFQTESAAEFEKIKRYQEQLFDEGVVTHAFHTADGKLIHCIEIGSQRSITNAGLKSGEIRTAPEVLPLVERTISGEKTANASDFGLDGTTDAEGNLRRCPAGSIPVLIPSLEDLCRFKTFDDIFRKFPNGTKQTSFGTVLDQTRGNTPLPPVDLENPTAVVHDYAHASRTVDNQGQQAAFNVWQPSVERSDEFSLSQLWVGRAAGTISNHQTVETGWQVCYLLYDDSRPHLFIYSTTHNYEDGYPGGYNLGSGMFVQTNSTVIIGGAFSPVSTQGGTQYDVRLMFYRDQGGNHDWWLKYEDTWVGYYPNSYYNSNGIADKGASIDYGGEIVNDNVGGIHTTTDMGSGHFPSEGWQHSAYVRNLTYVDMSNVTRNSDGLSRSVTNSSLYDLSLYFSSDSNWTNYFFFGGPGHEGPVTPGTHDYNSDGKSDLIWQSANTGQVVLWFMDGQGNEQSGKSVQNGASYPGWNVMGAGDLNSDGKSDFMWQNASNGQVYVWFMDGQGNQQGGRYFQNGATYPGWNVMPAGDLNGDGKSDVMWQNASNGQVYIWFMDGQGNQQGGRYIQGGATFPGWRVMAAGDLNSDGKTDIMWQDTSNGQVYIWFMDGQGNQQGGRYIQNGSTFPGWNIVAGGDLNSDGKSDLIWQNASSGQAYIWFMDVQGNQQGGRYVQGGTSFAEWKIKP
jgi:neprosin-like protein/VCBS repeat protein/FG-GAP repeat protein